jgi:hypothetical protein
LEPDPDETGVGSAATIDGRHDRIAARQRAAFLFARPVATHLSDHRPRNRTGVKRPRRQTRGTGEIDGQVEQRIEGDVSTDR